MQTPPLIRIFTACGLLAALMGLLGCANSGSRPAARGAAPTGTLLHADDFQSLAQWQIEKKPGGSVHVAGNKLVVDVPVGCTVWFRPELRPPFTISYRATMIGRGGPNDRVSDLNCFWLATDPRVADGSVLASSAQRTGVFKEYDGLALYYLGMGGNSNTTTRFRRYLGTGEKPLLPEHDLRDASVLLEPNRTYTITLTVADGRVQFYRDGRKVIDWRDPDPLTQGRFGFRTVQSHFTVEDFRVWRGAHQP